MTRQALAAAFLAAVAVGVVNAAGTAPVSDLSITNTDGAPTYTAGDTLTYTVVVANAGPDEALAAAVTDPVALLPQVSSATWTCVGAGGATCPAGTNTGGITGTVNLPVGGTATYTLVVRVGTGATGDLVTTATVTAPAGSTDPNTTNNTAIDTDTRATIFYVSTTGTDSTTCGPTATPCKTVQGAIGRTAPGDTVLVNDGTFNECISVQPGTGTGGIMVASNTFFLGGDGGGAVLDGVDKCDGSDLEAPAGPVVMLHDKSALRGFAIKNAGDSGVQALGAVAILGNLIGLNDAQAYGGGINLATGVNLTDPARKAEIKSNSIFTNTAGTGGAGIYVNARAEGIPSQVVIDGNTLTSNTAGADANLTFGGGIMVTMSTASGTDTSSVVITNNTLNGNVATVHTAGTGFAYGGGIYVSTTGPGTETVTIGGTGAGNVLRNNTAEGFGGGMSIQVQPTQAGRHTANVSTNSVSAGTASLGGGGLHLSARAIDLPAAASQIVLTASDNSITGNHALGEFDDVGVAGGGGIFAELYSGRTSASNVQFELSGNKVQGNSATTHGGGLALTAMADDDPVSDGATAPAGAIIACRNNLIATNAARDATANVPSGGGVYGLGIARGSTAISSLVLDFLTIAKNQTELGTGGLLWEDRPLTNSLGSKGTVSFKLSNSIISENEGYGVGPNAPLDISTSLAISYNDADGNISGNYDPLMVDPTNTNGNVSVDAELDALFLPRICGPVIDQGDPTIPATTEPQPNGGRVNLGHLGNTASATRTFPDVNADGTIDGLDVLGIAVSFNSTTGNPRYFVAADRDLDGIVDGVDLSYVSAFYAQSCP